VWKKNTKNCEVLRSLAPKLSRIRGLYGQTVYCKGDSAIVDLGRANHYRLAVPVKYYAVLGGVEIGIGALDWGS
jgi:hypothetical protein